MSENLRILIVDDDRRIAGTLVDILNVKGYEAEAAFSGAEALDKVKKGRFDCVLTDIKMPEMNGVELYKAITAVHPGLPVVLMTAYASDKLVEEGLQEGVIASLTKPLDISMLLSFFYAVRKETSIVIVDDNPAFCKTMGDILSARGFAVTQVTDPHNWEENLRPDVQIVLLDMKLNSINGLDVLEQIRKIYPDLPVILVTGYREEMLSAIKMSMEINAYTCLYKPLQIEQLIQVLGEIKHREMGRILGRPAGKRKKGEIS